LLMIVMPSVSRPDPQRARELRDQMTDAEVRLWFRLRANQMGGHHFRRQVPMGPYVVDFLCVKAQLVVEVDGSQHQSASAEMKSARRGSEVGASESCVSGTTKFFNRLKASWKRFASSCSNPLP